MSQGAAGVARKLPSCPWLNVLTHRAAADFYVRFSGLARRIVNRRLGCDPDASDVVQEAFTQIFRNLHQLENPDQVEHWVARVTAHTIHKELRHRRRRVRLVPAEHADSALARFGYDQDWEGARVAPARGKRARARYPAAAAAVRVSDARFRRFRASSLIERPLQGGACHPSAHLLGAAQAGGRL